MSLKFQGNLHKMHVQIGSPVRYQLELSKKMLVLNDWLGKDIRIEYLQSIECTHCGRAMKKSFNQGYCYPCFRSLAQCDICIMSPEKCHYHLGTCREPEWGTQFCMKPHIVYLSNTSGVKVGVTRETQIPTRWIDQGARQAMPILRVSKRYNAGLVEVAFKKFLNDKTNWRTMLKNEFEPVDLLAVFNQYWPEVEAGLDDGIKTDVEVMASADAMLELEFPANSYPSKISSFNLDKNPLVEGRLDAIKGQYLIMNTGVINIRKYSGYLVSLEA
jgi:hypothetical protein